MATKLLNKKGLEVARKLKMLEVAMTLERIGSGN